MLLLDHLRCSYVLFWRRMPYPAPQGSHPYFQYYWLLFGCCVVWGGGVTLPIHYLATTPVHCSMTRILGLHPNSSVDRRLRVAVWPGPSMFKHAVLLALVVPLRDRIMQANSPVVILVCPDDRPQAVPPDNHKEPPLPLPSIDANGGPATSLPVPPLGCMDGYLVGRATSGRKLAGRTACASVW